MSNGNQKNSECADRSAIGPWAWWSLALFWIAYVISMIDRFALTMMVEPIKRDLGIGDTMIGLLHGLPFSVFLAASGWLIARWVDRGSRRLVAAAGLFFWSLSTAAAGLAQNTWQLMLSRIGVAAGEASLFPCATSLIADLFPPHRRGLAMGIYASAAFIGLGLSFAVTGALLTYFTAHPLTLPLIGQTAAWQTVFVALGLPGMLFALLMLSVKEPRTAAGAPAAFVNEPIRPYLRCHLSLLWRFLGGIGLLAIAANATLIWIAPLLTRSFDWSPDRVGQMLALSLVGPGLLGAIVGGLVADRWRASGRTDARLQLLALICALAGLPILGLALAPTGEMAALAFACYVFTYGVVGATAPSGLQEIAPKRLHGRMAALYIAILSAFGMGVGSSLVGGLSEYLFPEKTGLQLALPIVAGAATLAAGLLLASGSKTYIDAVRQNGEDGPEGLAETTPVL